MSIFLSEILGTFITVLLGYNAVLLVSGNNKGINKKFVSTLGWGLSLFVGMICINKISGAHLNPAVTIGLAFIGKFQWYKAPMYILAQLTGAIMASCVVLLQFKSAFDTLDDISLSNLVFTVKPDIKIVVKNIASFIASSVIFIFPVLYIAVSHSGFDAYSSIPVAFLFFGACLVVSNSTGFIINPVADLGMRIVVTAYKHKHGNNIDWRLSWVPFFCSFAGTTIAATLYDIFR